MDKVKMTRVSMVVEFDVWERISVRDARSEVKRVVSSYADFADKNGRYAAPQRVTVKPMPKKDR